MKNDQKVYLQKYEVAFILHKISIVPANFMNELFRHERTFIMNGPKDGYNFDCVFEDPGVVSWLMNQDWIVDYDKCKNESNVMDMREEVIEKAAAEIKRFNASDAEYQEKHFPEYKERLDKFRHTVYSLEVMICYFKNEVCFVLPGGMDDYSDKPAKKPGFFARLFGRGTQ